MGHAVLIIEDEDTLARNIKSYLERTGLEARIEADGESGLEAFDEFKPDIVLLDLRLPGMGGIEILQRIRKMDKTIKVVMMTAHGTVLTAVEAMKEGAYDYLTKPVVLSELKRLVDRAIGEDQIKGTLSYYHQRDARNGGLDHMLGESAPLQSLKDKIRQLLNADHMVDQGPAAPVLITGETGTGKDLVARAIHFDGPRGDRPFIEINCAVLPATLVEDELFGHERGAFTDAKDRKIGLIEAANGGSLFLNEIGELGLDIQAKLLKILEDKKVRRLGDVRERTVDVRIIAATNQNLEDRVRNHTFRSDLYFRLKIANFETPPLRQRGNDIVLLANHFLALFQRRYQRKAMSFSEAAMGALMRYPWPGNVRELSNVIEQAVLFSGTEVITAERLTLSNALIPMDGNGDAAPSLGALAPNGNGLDLTETERNLVGKALDQAKWNVTQAAEFLGISRDTLRYRIEKFGFKRPA